MDVTFKGKTYQNIVADQGITHSSWQKVHGVDPTSPVNARPTLQLTEPEGSAANVLVPEIIAHLQRFCEVHELVDQGCFGGTSGPVYF